MVVCQLYLDAKCLFIIIKIFSMSYVCILGSSLCPISLNIRNNFPNYDDPSLLPTTNYVCSDFLPGGI